ncbi:MAG TPA: hypothetical protein VG267_17630 [Terracidiphilus sp.]|nr:hypothetical protein [Terracidiphilus sp.]
MANVGGHDRVADLECSCADEKIQRRNSDSDGSLFAVDSAGEECRGSRVGHNI